MKQIDPLDRTIIGKQVRIGKVKGVIIDVGKATDDGRPLALFSYSPMFGPIQQFWVGQDFVKGQIPKDNVVQLTTVTKTVEK